MIDFDFSWKKEYLEIAIASFAVLWVFFKSTDWYSELLSKIRESKLELVYRTLEAATVKTYHDYVRDIKLSERKLNKLEKVNAMNKTIRDTKKSLEKAKIYPEVILGPGGPEAFVERTIQELKRGDM